MAPAAAAEAATDVCATLPNGSYL